MVKGKASREQDAGAIMQYRALWISDVHLGSRHAQARALLEFLRGVECRHLYLVGDIVDGWELRRRWQWDPDANTVVQKILRMNRKETRVTYLYGNHDEFMEGFAGLSLGGVQLMERTIHVTADGRRLLVLHGHQLDGLVHFNRLLERVGSRAYDWILDLNLHFNRVRRRLGFGYWSVASYLKLQAKSAVQYVTQFEEGMCRLAATSRVDGIICGHIHRAEMRVIDGMTYMNCGDWVESCTALAEHFDGSFELIRYHERGAVGGGQGAQAPVRGNDVPERARAPGARLGDPGGKPPVQPELAGLL